MPDLNADAVLQRPQDKSSNASISPARQKRVEKTIEHAMAEVGVEQFHQSIANVLHRQRHGARKAKPGAPKIFTETGFKDLWLTVQMAMLDLDETGYGCCMRLTSVFYYGDEGDRKKVVKGSILYRQYLHAVHFMKTNGCPKQKVPAGYGGSDVSVMEKRWRWELDFNQLAKLPADEWSRGLRALRDNYPQDSCIFAQ